MRRRHDDPPAANAEPPRRARKINDTKQSADDLAILEQLNNDYVHADQFSDVQRFNEFLAEDFIVQTPGITRNRAEFLEYIAKPRPFKDLAVHDVTIRILSDVALIHARSTYTMLADGAQREALYTDTYQKRAGIWVCVAACAIAPGT
ncbi:nuclear transport factor 2 family protein [Kibdelosporangium aridum]|uniref:nuclear transport factor 2 family protein n=1 Tax=Kibdelosporangium aridum TaxID=2030 RepID=UPI000A9ADA64|nr:nuclear transport factor 2 family protein [Kibdelosporangium aridum]